MHAAVCTAHARHVLHVPPRLYARALPWLLQMAQEARERMHNSKLYSLGRGYTEVISGSVPVAGGAESSSGGCR